MKSIELKEYEDTLGVLLSYYDKIEEPIIRVSIITPLEPMYLHFSKKHQAR